MWVLVDQVRARQSPCFGVKDTLKVVLWLLLLAAFSELLRAGVRAFAVFSLADFGDWRFVSLAILVLLRLVVAGWMLHVALNGLAGVRSFARDAPPLLLLMLLAYVAGLALRAVQLGGELFQARLPEIVPELLLTFGILGGLLIYGRGSRRVNATYRYRLLAEEAAAAPAAAS